MITAILLAGGAAILAWLGARWSLTLPHYEGQRRAIPYRTAVTVLLAAGLAGVAAAQFSSGWSALFAALWSLVFALIAVIDIETHFIPDVIVLPATAAALLASGLDPRLAWWSALLGAVVGFLIFFLIAWAARGGFGMGDVKLAAFIGAVTGLLPLFYGMVVGIFAGGVGALLLLVSRRMARRSFMPYGPYLCLGGWVALLPAVLRFWGIGP